MNSNEKLYESCPALAKFEAEIFGEGILNEWPWSKKANPVQKGPNPYDNVLSILKKLEMALAEIPDQKFRLNPQHVQAFHQRIQAARDAYNQQPIPTKQTGKMTPQAGFDDVPQAGTPQSATYRPGTGYADTKTKPQPQRRQPQEPDWAAMANAPAQRNPQKIRRPVL